MWYGPRYWCDDSHPPEHMAQAVLTYKVDIATSSEAPQSTGNWRRLKAYPQLCKLLRDNGGAETKLTGQREAGAGPMLDGPAIIRAKRRPPPHRPPRPGHTAGVQRTIQPRRTSPPTVRAHLFVTISTFPLTGPPPGPRGLYSLQHTVRTYWWWKGAPCADSSIRRRYIFHMTRRQG